MLRFKPKNRNRVSNRLAIFASVMLLISALAGMNHTTPDQSGHSSDYAGKNSNASEQTVINNQSRKQANSKKGFKVSLFLFRLD